jgi:hypothetical protein
MAGVREPEETYELLRVPAHLAPAFREVAEGSRAATIRQLPQRGATAAESFEIEIDGRAPKLYSKSFPMARVVQAGKEISNEGIVISGNVARTLVVSESPTDFPGAPPAGRPPPAVFGFLSQFSAGEVAEVDSLLSELLLKDVPAYEHVMEELVDAEEWMAPWLAGGNGGGDNFTLLYENGKPVLGYTVREGGEEVTLARAKEMHAAAPTASAGAGSSAPAGEVTGEALPDDSMGAAADLAGLAGVALYSSVGITEDEFAALQGEGRMFEGNEEEDMQYELALAGMAGAGAAGVGGGHAQTVAPALPVGAAAPSGAGSVTGPAAAPAAPPPAAAAAPVSAEAAALAAAKADVERLRGNLEKALPAMRTRLGQMLTAAEVKLARLSGRQ